MEFLNEGLDEKIKQAAEFDRTLKYVKQKVLLPSRLGSGDLGSQVFSDIKEMLNGIRNDIITFHQVSQQRCRLEELERVTDELEKGADDTERSWMENCDYVPFLENPTNDVILSPINATISFCETIGNESILSHTPAFNNFVARRLNFEESLKKF